MWQNTAPSSGKMPRHDFGRALPPTLSVPRTEARDLSFRVTIPFSARASALWSDQLTLKEPAQVGSCLLSKPSGVSRAPERWISLELKEEVAPAKLIEFPWGMKPKPRDPSPPLMYRPSGYESDISLREPAQAGPRLLYQPGVVNRAPERWIQSERKEELAPANLIPRGMKPKPRDPRSLFKYSPSMGYETDMSYNDFPGAGLKTQSEKLRKAAEFRRAPPEVIRPQVKPRSPLEYPAVVGRSAALAVTEVINGRSGNRPPPGSTRNR